MAAPFIIPFNFQPIATTIRAASYTVPTSRYARIIIPDEKYNAINGIVYSITNTSQTVNLTNQDVSLCVGTGSVFTYSFLLDLTISSTAQGAQRNLIINLPNNYVDFSGFCSFSILSNAGATAGDGVYIYKAESSDYFFNTNTAYLPGRLSSVLFRLTKSNASGTHTIRAIVSNFRKQVNNNNPIWVEPGTVINCPSFGQYITEEYSVIS